MATFMAPAMAIAVAVLAGVAMPDLASDRAECADRLAALATCLAFVDGDAASPTPDCCSGLKQVLAGSPKCLCMLVKDRDEPNLGIKLNVTRAMGLPQACRLLAHISNCPKLLNLPKDSKDAKIFEQFGNGTQGGAANNDKEKESWHPTGAGRSCYLKGKELQQIKKLLDRSWIWPLVILPLMLLGC